MLIDILFAVLLVMAVIKGYQRGLIVAIFSILAFIIGLAAAMKLSALVAAYIGKTVNISEKWLPIVAFIVVFAIVVLLIRWGAALIQKSVQFVMLGWANRIGGIILYAALYFIILSVLLFYAGKVQFINAETIAASKTYPFIQPWGPRCINGFGSIIPVFKNMFEDLQHFFGDVGTTIG
jgi:membrane protein required for colicin V production